ncbi:riboflavin synthase subunit alpha [Shouchella clausii]|uniref:riboflavin synthase n=1 Tax=Shouchella tritolerans TaxID=2979466 RepID=UPI000786BA2F|nr:riboflavin synthase [Shouchella tritolerans]GIN10734.1 riboflavin synthase subunit alpha [Shouchella clausii]
MFTGIIEEMGKIAFVSKKGKAMTLAVNCKTVLADAAIGDSIAVNGVCLTVTAISESQFQADVMPETYEATTIKQLVPGQFVNLERAMAVGSRFGGHIISGHVDGIGIIQKRQPVENAVLFEVEADRELVRYIVQKGSIAVDGTSLTVFAVTDTSFTISIIPHTLEMTIMGTKKPGDHVNLECDIIGKYVEKLLAPKESAVRTPLSQLLKENSYM